MVRNQKIVRLAEEYEAKRQQKEEDRRRAAQGLPPRRDADQPEEDSPECCAEQKPPIPEGWVREYDEVNKMTYYYHQSSTYSTWRRPRLAEPPNSAQVAVGVPVAVASTVVAAEHTPKPPSAAPTGKDRSAAILDDMCWSVQLVFCWCCLYSAV